jgi:hypothetical protein
MSELKYHLVNSFSATSPTSGSQCAVVLLPHADSRMADDDWLQTIASNFSYPATSFLVPKSAEDGAELEYDLRWFAVGVWSLSRDSYGPGSRAGAPVLRPRNTGSVACSLQLAPSS